jgi:tetratricopeptide (TPR) repeat protein
LITQENSMDKNTSEIAKLTERISKDPKSKLFVPLAEEYKKSGDIEMAIHVLTEGLKNNPGYVTARSFLGRLLFDMGDLTSARREFEEVVKAVPDNLLAQKKLGDLHVLLGNRTEALKYYISARSLNPADAEIASFVADLEAGVDVRPRLLQPKSAPAPEPVVTGGLQPVPQQKTAGPAKMETHAEAAGTGVRTEETGPKQEEATAPEMPVVPTDKAAFAAISQAPASAVPEEAEEVLVVEPLDEEVPSEQAPSLPSEERGRLRETETPSSPAAAVGEAAPLEEVPAVTAEPEAAAERTSEVSDDFTTDTLAELYIGQGFYEKAIDIYERMLADRPDSRGLRDKLERVRSLAADSEAEASQAASEGGETATAEAEAEAETQAQAQSALAVEAPEYIPLAPAGTAGEEIILEADLIVEPEEAAPDTEIARGSEDLFAEPKEYRPPPPETGETSGTEEDKFFDVVMNPPTEEFTGAGPPPAFEPREYIPPTAELRKTTEEKEPVGLKQPGAGHKEIIDRLENWLKNIKKEI